MRQSFLSVLTPCFFIQYQRPFRAANGIFWRLLLISLVFLPCLLKPLVSCAWAEVGKSDNGGKVFREFLADNSEGVPRFSIESGNSGEKCRPQFFCGFVDLSFLDLKLDSIPCKPIFDKQSNKIAKDATGRETDSKREISDKMDQRAQDVLLGFSIGGWLVIICYIFLERCACRARYSVYRQRGCYAFLCFKYSSRLMILIPSRSSSFLQQITVPLKFAG